MNGLKNFLNKIKLKFVNGLASFKNIKFKAPHLKLPKVPKIPKILTGKREKLTPLGENLPADDQPDELASDEELLSDEFESVLPEKESTAFWKKQSRGMKERISKGAEALRNKLKNIKFSSAKSLSKEDLTNAFTSTLHRTKNATRDLKSLFDRGKLSTWINLFTVFLSAWFLSDIPALLIEDLIPEAPYVRAFRNAGFQDRAEIAKYDIIVSSGIFKSPDGKDAPIGIDPNQAPVRSLLPFRLIGTLVLSNELRSIATLSENSSNQIYPVRPNDEITSKLRVLTVEPRRVIFVNLRSRQKEYLDLPKEGGDTPTITLGKASPGLTPSAGIDKVNENHFRLNRAVVDTTLADLNSVLTQARAVPHQQNGQTVGYKLFQIVPNSIYDQLGLQNGDLLRSLDGESLSDPSKAFQLLNQLKSARHLELSVERNGKLENFSYDID